MNTGRNLRRLDDYSNDEEDKRVMLMFLLKYKVLLSCPLVQMKIHCLVIIIIK